MNKRLFIWSLTPALAGFLFGFDTAVISGAEQTIQKLWSLSDGMHGLAMSMALWGTVIGAMLGGFPADRYGRRKTLIGIGVLYLISALASALAPDVSIFMIARFLGGLGVGASTIAAPLYIAEIAPSELRGRLTGLFQFNIVFGILVAFISNAAISGVGVDAWRWMLGIETAPALIFLLGCTKIPRSPRWLLTHRNARDEALAVLRQTHPEASEAQLISKALEVAQTDRRQGVAQTDRRQGVAQTDQRLEVDRGSKPRFWTRKLRRPITLAILIAFFNQLSGINAVVYFAPRIFELTGLGEQAALLQSIGIGVTNLVFTVVGLLLIDRLGRRTLLVIGSFGYIFSLGLCSFAFYSETYAIVPACIFAFIAAHAIGQGAVIWVFISEIFPNQNRAQGQALGSFTHWIFAASLTFAFPTVVGAFAPATIFMFFCAMMVLQLFWIRWMVPETKGVSLEQMEEHLRTS
ncbi:MAG: sugar porter family MFS transporter [Planctomycetes bacterium]|nr:sugar porter family MFS transporter [Planctomycetota bacterium]